MTRKNMPEFDSSDFFRLLRAANGYAELGMWSDAWDQLEEIAPEQRYCFEVGKLRVRILLALKRWDAVAILAESLITLGAADADVFLAAAEAVCRVRSIADAKAILLRAEPRIQDNAEISFRLACYECQSGELERAKTRLKRAIEMDSKFRSRAIEDEDLKPLWDAL